MEKTTASLDSEKRGAPDIPVCGAEKHRDAKRALKARGPGKSVKTSANAIRGPPSLPEIASKLAWTIAEFCKLHHLSVSNYYELRKSGLTPAEMKIRNRVWITREAAAAWREAHTGTNTNEAA
jgi:hypothetical protein